METGDQNSSVEVAVVDPQEQLSIRTLTQEKAENIALQQKPCELQNFDKRLDTFLNWPKQMRQIPFFLAMCGFIYSGIGDCVQCLHCTKAMCHWEIMDDPLLIHEALSPECPFILANKQSLAEVSRDRRYRKPNTSGCKTFDPSAMANDQPAVMVPLPEQAWSLKMNSFISTG